MRILIANRGEVARRIIRTARRLGHETVAAWADPDRNAPFVSEATFATRLGPAELSASYLSIDAILLAAKRSGADAVHPGYGFLAERPALAEAVMAAGLTWIGPRVEAMSSMGSKIEARRLAEAAGVPVIPGYDASQDPDDLARGAAAIGFPVLVKASAGGGGKGIRVAAAPGDLPRALAEATAEAARAFGDSRVLIERFVGRPRHIEVQIIGDRFGSVIDLGTRECSLQRNYQKVIEEAPAPNLAPELDAALRRSAVQLAAAIDYDSVGTVEFLVDDDDGRYFFLEMNTRLQVEHTVTECVTGLDLVELQILVAEGRPLPMDAAQVVVRGHAFEARINAEDPWDGFAPRVGRIEHLRVPVGVRWDSAVDEGSEISPFYDSLIAKLIVAGSDRDTARRDLVRALDELIVAGPTGNGGFIRWLLVQEPVVAGRATTRFVDETALPAADDGDAIDRLAAVLWNEQRGMQRTSPGSWSRMGPFRSSPHTNRAVVLLEKNGIVCDALPDGEVASTTVAHVDIGRRLVAVNVYGATHTYRIPPREERWLRSLAPSVAASSALRSPFPAVVVEVCVAPGDDVVDGQVLIIIEAMKMLHSLLAQGTGTVSSVPVSAGEQVGSGATLGQGRLAIWLMKR